MKTAPVILAALLLAAAAPPAAAQLELHGYIEAATGTQLASRDGTFDLPEFTIRETRLQLKGDLYGDVGESHFVLDVLADQVTDTTSQQLREAFVKFNAFADKLEVRAGRQPTTWGTGDLLFINDLFPKDYQSFFVGRDDQYLKSPSDALRLGLFSVLPVSVDLVYTPEFTPDITPTGERLLFWAPAYVPVQRPEDEIGNGELAVRLSRYVGSWNWAAYGYRGRWKNPQGAMADGTGMLTGFYYPELNVVGASTRGPLFGGIAWLEGGYYDSREDEAGAADLLVPNSEIRGLVGYERQWWSDFTGGLQFYWEGMQDHARTQAALDAAIAGGMPEESAYLKDENRTLVTLRLMQMFNYQTVTATCFTFFSPSDEDAYVRLSLGYDYSDQLELTLGGNLFTGNDGRTLFGMNEDNSNVYTRVRFSF